MTKKAKTPTPINAPGIDPDFFYDADMVVLKARVVTPDARAVASRLCGSRDLVAEVKELARVVRDVYQGEATKLEVLKGYHGFFDPKVWPEGLEILRAS